jgi:hypothetical protein
MKVWGEECFWLDGCFGAETWSRGNSLDGSNLRALDRTELSQHGFLAPLKGRLTQH